jgi:alkylated DNA nucleotide flippase Atl1
MALSRLVVALFRNRNLNQVWLGTLRSIAARAATDPDYARQVGCVLTGLPPDVSAVGAGTAARIFGQAMISPLAAASWHRLSRGRAARLAPAAPDEFRNWAAGTGLVLAEFATQLTRATITRSRVIERYSGSAYA